MIQWFYQSAQNEPVGPLTEDDFHAQAKAGRIGEDSLVWHTGRADWVPYREFRAQARPQPAAAPALAVSAGASATAAQAFADVSFANCAVCGDSWPENLLLGSGRKRKCAKCARAERKGRESLPVSGGVGMSSGWGVWLLKIGAIGVAAGFLVLGSAWLRGTKHQRRLNHQARLEALAREAEHGPAAIDDRRPVRHETRLAQPGKVDEIRRRAAAAER